jgi:hypothetical protein
MKLQRAGLKKFKLIDAIVVAGTLCLVSFGVWFNYLRQPSATCTVPGKSYDLVIQNGRFSTEKVTVEKCDSLKVINLDKQEYAIAFGTHENHIVYPGFREITLRTDEFVAIDAVQTGTYRIHDHLQDKAAVELTILPKK